MKYILFSGCYIEEMVKPCWKPSSVEGDGSRRGGGDLSLGRTNGLLWYKDLGPHVCGEFSMAVVQANGFLEDQSQVESGQLSSHNSGPFGTFVGVYDGHGGTEASRFVNDNLFLNLKSMFLLSLSLVLMYFHFCSYLLDFSFSG